MDSAVAKSLGEKGARLRQEKDMAIHIPYTRHVDANTVETKDGHLVQVIKLEGIAHETADQDEINHLKMVRNTMLKGLASRDLALWHHIVRRRENTFPRGEFPNGFAADLNSAWREQVTGNRMFVNDLYLSIARRSPHGVIGAMERFMRAFSNRVDKRAADEAMEKARKSLDDAVSRLVGNLRRYGARRLGIVDRSFGRCSEILECLNQLISAHKQPVLLPCANLSQYLGSVQPFFGHETIELRGPSSSRYAAALAIKEYRAETAPGMMDHFLEMPYEAIITQSFTFIERQQALESMKRQQRLLTNSGDDASSQRDEISDGIDDVASGRYAFGAHHLTVIPICESLGELAEAVTDTNSRLTDMGIIATRETGGDCELSYWAQLPANFGYIPRPAPISTLNFASFASFHNHPQGWIDGNHWGPAVTLLETISGTPLYFNFHVGDLGNTTVVGPTGTGKTLTMSFLAAQSERFKPRQIFFDNHRGAEIFIRAIGGHYSVLRPGTPTGFNPFQCEDTSDKRSFLVRLLETMVTAHGEILTAAERQRITRAINNLFELPQADRRLQNLAPFFPHGNADSLAARLESWYGSGEHAWLFDNDTDMLNMDVRVIGFDLTQILENPVVRRSAFYYMFERVDNVLDGQPTIISVDEGWKAIADIVFQPRIEDWERTIRKRGGIVIFGSQSASSIVKSPMGDVIIEQSPTQLFMPNLKADRNSYIDGFGLTGKEFELIRTLPKDSRCFLVKHGSNSAVARLNMDGLDDYIAVLSGRTETVRLLDGIRAELGDDPATWLPEFYQRRQK